MRLAFGNYVGASQTDPQSTEKKNCPDGSSICPTLQSFLFTFISLTVPNFYTVARVLTTGESKLIVHLEYGQCWSRDRAGIVQMS